MLLDCVSLYLLQLTLFNFLLLCQAVPHLEFSEKELKRRAITVGLGGRWPRGEVTYCFKGEKQDLLMSLFDAGWAIWAQYPGFPMRKNRLDSCDAEYWASKGLQQKDVLVVVQIDEGHPKCTVGKKDENELKFNPRFGGATRDLAAALAHELDHAFGMLHEHQKPGAGRHIKFTCQNLRDYDEKKKGKSKKEVIEMCTDQEKAYDAKFSAANIIPYGDNLDPYYRRDSDPNSADYIDWSSIMLYASDYGGKEIKQMPWDRHPLGKKNVMLKLDGSRIEENKVPSRRDIEALRDLYSHPFSDTELSFDFSEFSDPNPPTV